MVTWGSYEGGMRVGIDVTIGSVNTNSSDVDFVVRYYTDNSQSFNDSQTLNFSGSIGGSVNYTNNESGSSGAVLRATRTYTWNYSSGSYGSSPGTRTFTVSASGLYTGGTPSRSVTVNIPARPYAAPLAPTNVAATRISDTQTKITWTRNVTAQRPYTSQRVVKSVNGGGLTTVASGLDDALTSYTAPTVANTQYRFQVWAGNSIDVTESGYSGYLYTTPAAPTLAARVDIAGPGQRITWNNDAVGYGAYSSEVFASKNDGAYTSLGTVGSGVTTFDHLAANAVPYTASDRWKYIVRHYATNGNQRLYSADSNVTSETAGVTSQPDAPTNLNPTGGVSQDPTVIIPLTWQHNPTDTSAQTQYQIRHRLVGAGAWTTLSAVASAVPSHDLAANTYTNGQSVEWQVSTKGADAAFSPFSASATFVAVVSKKVPIYLDTGIGKRVADLTGGGWTAMRKPAAQVSRQATQSISDGGTSIAVSWDTVDFVRDGCTGSSSGIVVPLAGLYQVNLTLSLANSGLLTGGGGVATMFSIIAVNPGSGAYRSTVARGQLSQSPPTVQSGSALIMLDAGDVVTGQIFQNNNGARNLNGGTLYPNVLSLVYIGPET